MTTKKPTIVLIPGAWHKPIHYVLFTNSLTEQGYVVRCLKLPSVDAVDPTLTTLTTDATFVREELILPELDAGNDVIVIGHSYGGAIAGGAAKGLGRGDRGEGKSAVLGLIYMCALILSSGQGGITKEQLAPWTSLDEERGVTTIRDAEGSVYANVEDKEAVRSATEMAGTHSWTAFQSPSPPQAWEDSHWDGKRVYIRCGQDKAVPAQAQDFMVESTKVKWEIEHLEDQGHSPFMVVPGKLTDIVEKYAHQWAKEVR